eukprot:1080175-Pelagomonas_calceolata.AAC.2
MQRVKVVRASAWMYGSELPFPLKSIVLAFDDEEMQHVEAAWSIAWFFGSGLPLLCAPYYNPLDLGTALLVLCQVDAVMQRVEAVAKGVPEAQLKQAKQMAISSYKEGLASSAGMVGTMAPHLLLTGRFEPSDFAAKVRA